MSGVEAAPTQTRRPRRWKLLLFLPFVVVAVVGFVMARGVGCFLLTRFTGYSTTSFDSGAWKSNWTCRCTPLRMQMAHDLKAATDMRGWDRARVIDLLGPADPDAYIQGYERPGTLIYHLAPSFLDNYWFLVRFDDTDHVTEGRVIED